VLKILGVALPPLIRRAQPPPTPPATPKAPPQTLSPKCQRSNRAF